ncbi:MAG: ANTAR domain-containing response regulator [Nitrospirota bacterium]
MTASAPTSAPQPASAHLLLVDDDRLILATLSSGLQDMGYQVSTAESVDDAEALLTSGLRPDLAIVDVRMPGRDGLQLAERLRDLDHIPFLMLSAFSDAQNVERASGFGALGYLVKPMDVVQIQPTIEAALLRAREIEHLRQSRAQLQEALDGDRSINVATGITMMQYRLPLAAAFELLRSAARSQRRKLADLAQEVIDTCDRLHSPRKS